MKEFYLVILNNTFNLTMDMEHKPERQQINRRAEHSRRPTTGLQNIKKGPHPTAGFCWPLKIMRTSTMKMDVKLISETYK